MIETLQSSEKTIAAIVPKVDMGWIAIEEIEYQPYPDEQYGNAVMATVFDELVPVGETRYFRVLVIP